MGTFLASLGLTRDSLLIAYGKFTGLVLAAAALLSAGGAIPGIPETWDKWIFLAAFVIGGGSAHYGNSPLPGKSGPNGSVNVAKIVKPVILIAGLLLGGSFVSACATATPPNLTPAQAAQYHAAVTADSVSQAIAALRATAVQLNAEGSLDVHVTADIVRFDLASQQTLASAPNGWQATVASGWKGLKAALPASVLQNPAVASSITTLDGLLGYLAGAQR